MFAKIPVFNLICTLMNFNHKNNIYYCYSIITVQRSLRLGVRMQRIKDKKGNFSTMLKDRVILEQMLFGRSELPVQLRTIVLKKIKKSFVWRRRVSL
jgi:hypothetical protein